MAQRAGKRASATAAARSRSDLAWVAMRWMAVAAWMASNSSPSSETTVRDVAVVGQGGELGLDGAAAAEIALTGGAATAAGGTATAAGASAGRRGVGLGGDGEGDAVSARGKGGGGGRSGRRPRERGASRGEGGGEDARGARATRGGRRGRSGHRRWGAMRHHCGARRPRRVEDRHVRFAARGDAFSGAGINLPTGGGPARRKASARGRGVRRGSGEQHARRETARDGTGVRRLRVVVCRRGWGETHAIQQQQQPPGRADELTRAPPALPLPLVVNRPVSSQSGENSYERCDAFFVRYPVIENNTLEASAA